MVIFSCLFFFPDFFFVTHVYEPIENRVFHEYLSKNIIFSIWQCGTVSRTQLAVFCFRYRIQERDCRSRGLYAIYIYPHANMAVHRCASDVDCIRSTCETRFLLVQRPDDEIANALPGCFNGRHYWAKCIYAKNCKSRGKCTYCVTYMHLSWRFYSRTWNLPTQ